MELIGLDLPDEAVSKVYEIRDICTKKIKEEIDREFGSY
ncbi:hypothetical protein Tsac_2877 [Thermoanaerobacterium phage THSA-485A]|nr:hypothetical protein Tsac_2877 [Thermoanaerobacterium phage THSA-485A]AFK87730.1 hypothetical protein Tsac_2877 [Thermoanaerobacterium phage THSA-485A]